MAVNACRGDRSRPHWPWHPQASRRHVRRAHNAPFELSVLEKAGVAPREIHCTQQTSRLLTGENWPDLEFAAQEFLGIKLDKDAANVRLERAEPFAGTVALRRDGRGCRPQAGAAYAADARRAGERGTRSKRPPCLRWSECSCAAFCSIATAHAAPDRGARTQSGSKWSPPMRRPCREPASTTPCRTTPPQIGALLDILLNSAELAAWKRTAKSQALSTKRVELRKAKHYPPIAALLDLVDPRQGASPLSARTTPRLSTRSPGAFIAQLWDRAPPRQGGRPAQSPTCSRCPRRKRSSRNLFGAAPGYVLIVGDYDLMELRASAYISGDQRDDRGSSSKGGTSTRSPLRA